ncbi:MAG: hypothetical protein HKN23_16080 [Verrucomicrobiales bacterium]|nr:hypothetical protein [Verrucomicrobiales bacterium]
MTEEQLEKIKEEAYAQIIWGDDKQEVVQFLIGQGVSIEEADKFVKQASRERAAEIRRQGFQNILIGGLMIAGSLIGITIYYSVSEVVLLKLVGLIAVPGVIGIFQVLKGISRLLLGKETGAISEME